MWEFAGPGLLTAGSVSALAYLGMRAVGHRISASHRGRWTLMDGDLPEDIGPSRRYGRSGPDEALIHIWVKNGIPKRTGIRNLSNNMVTISMLYSRTGSPKVNEYIMSLRRSGRIGSEHKLHPRADYDFDLTSWATILHLFGDEHDVLYPDTVRHIVDVMMEEERRHPSIYVPWTAWTFLETENHVLMTEGSYYLCSKWLKDRGMLKGSGHSDPMERESFLSRYLDSIIHKGLYEFNSDPYSSYTIHALLNLESFGSKDVSDRARTVLDGICLFYQIGSLGHRRYPPFRRRRDRSSVTSLIEDGARPYMMVWDGSSSSQVWRGHAHMLIGSLLKYRPPDLLKMDDLFDGDGITALIGHGPGSSPEIYSRGKGYLITAGGVYRGPVSRLVNRPTTLLIDDGSDDLSGIVHMGGLGIDQRGSNNTGVVRNIAVGQGPVHIPQGWTARTKGIWSIMERNDLSILVHSEDHFGMFCVLENPSSIGPIIELNPDAHRLGHEFRWPDGRRATFDVGSPRDRWSVLSLDGTRTDRDFDTWPKLRMIGD